MTRTYIFADEAGNFDFSLNGSAYFIVTAVIMSDWSHCARAILEVRHELALSGAELLPEGFHATEDKQRVRDSVYNVIGDQSLFVHAVVLEKRKAIPSLACELGLYQTAWHYLFRWMLQKHSLKGSEVHVVAGTLGTKAKRRAFEKALSSVVNQHGGDRHVTSCWTASSHPCLQLADYCCWAIQRKYQRGDARSYDQIKDKIASCFELFKHGKNSYY